MITRINIKIGRERIKFDILNFLFENEGSSTNFIARGIDRSIGTIYPILAIMESEGDIERTPYFAGNMRRPIVVTHRLTVSGQGLVEKYCEKPPSTEELLEKIKENGAVIIE